MEYEKCLDQLQFSWNTISIVLLDKINDDKNNDIAQSLNIYIDKINNVLG
jgi:hypothetical protein